MPRATTFVVEPQTMFVPLLEQVLTAAKLRVVDVSAALDIDRAVAIAPDVLFIDPDFDPADTLEAVRQARSALPHARICLFTSRHRPAYSDACLGAGADCVISKAATEPQVRRALSRALRGVAYADPRVDAA